MRKISTILVMGLMIGFFFSCGKTTRNKVSKTWKIVEYREDSQIDYSYSTECFKETGDEKSFTRIDWENNDTTFYLIGQFDKNEMTINKDGTWSSEKIYDSRIIYSYQPETDTYFAKVTKKASGTWYFLGKNKVGDFQKNEKITFFTLGEFTKIENSKWIYHNHSTDTEFVQEQPENNSQKYKTYKIDEKATTYLITESRSDLLKLKSVSDYFYNSIYGVDESYNTEYTSQFTQAITLKKK